MSDKTYHSRSEDETIAIARDYAATLKDGDVVFLGGTLGAGKSVFARSIIRTLTGDPELVVPSPTFTLVQMYETQAFPIWHFDLYRLDDPQEIYEIGWEEALSEGVLLIEWSEKLGPLTPKQVHRIDIEILSASSASSDTAHRRVIIRS